jgi:membrane protease YdiL (CAAX protease family)
MSTSDSRDPDARTRAHSTSSGPEAHGSVPAESRPSYREEVTERQKEQFGGIKFGSAFFGWLAATGLVVLLTALAVAIATAVSGGVEEAVDSTISTPFGGIVVYAIVVLVILFIAYYCGGYVAGRMARFSGAKQGLAVWLWAIIIAIVAAVLGLVLGNNILADLNTFPRIPTSTEDLTTEGIVTAVLAALVSLGGAILGGLAGMRFHRRVDRAGLGR